MPPAWCRYPLGMVAGIGGERLCRRSRRCFWHRHQPDRREETGVVVVVGAAPDLPALELKDGRAEPDDVLPVPRRQRLQLSGVIERELPFGRRPVLSAKGGAQPYLDITYC